MRKSHIQSRIAAAVLATGLSLIAVSPAFAGDGYRGTTVERMPGIYSGNKCLDELYACYQDFPLLNKSLVYSATSAIRKMELGN